MKRYVAEYGDYLAKIAADHGSTVGAIWNHPANAQHRAKRSGPHSLYPGDVLMIPVPENPLVLPDPTVPPAPALPQIPPFLPSRLGGRNFLHKLLRTPHRMPDRDAAGSSTPPPLFFTPRRPDSPGVEFAFANHDASLQHGDYRWIQLQ